MSPSSSCTQYGLPWAPVSGGRPEWPTRNRPATERPDKRTEDVRINLIPCSSRVLAQEDGAAIVGLLAKSLAAVCRELAGCASLFRGPHSENAWGERLHGDGRAFSLCDLCRLVVHPAREAHAAVLALVTVILEPLGYYPARIEDDPRPALINAVRQVLYR